MQLKGLNDIIITKADKGNSIVILNKETYEKKILEVLFLCLNQHSCQCNETGNKIHEKTREFM